jgi:DNA (cytosine-5)-methyltransferase 1
MGTPAKPIVIDLFAGVGGLSLGFHRAGFQVVSSFDLDPINVQTYRQNFPTTVVVETDVCSLSGKEVRKLSRLTKNQQIDVVCGGPPCQGFSLMGKRLLNDPRNQLLIESARLISELRPRYFVIENVAGLMIGEARSVLARALRVLRAAGYRWVSPIRILDARDYGVPQIRKRVVVLGYRIDQARPSYPRKSRLNITVHEAIRDLYAIGRYASLQQKDHFDGKLGPESAYSLKLRARRRSALTGCQLCCHKPHIVQRFRTTRPGCSEPVSRFPRLHPHRPAPTLRAGTGKDRGSFTAARPIHPTQPRCITVREAARLQSFPDWFAFHPTQWHGFRQVGNAVPPHLAHAVACGVLRALS